MAGIYVHIPFCKQACTYCNFHFATSTAQKNELLTALLAEMELRTDYLSGESIETIYFGGGTPSLLSLADIKSILEKIQSLFSVSLNAEVTLETNPDDMGDERLAGWRKLGINRLSIGIQSFFQEHLQWMNRAHNADQARECVPAARKAGFENFSIDLIYGFPSLTDSQWKENVQTAMGFHIPHLSCYALTVEGNTPLQKMIRQQQALPVNPDQQAAQFLQLMNWMKSGGYEHYEISNFCKPGFRSRHNTSYWPAQAGGFFTKYLGLGPSAHSFDGLSRQWNIANNRRYIDSIQEGIIPFEKEVLSATERLNEYIMTSLRTKEGLNLGVAGEILDSPIEEKSLKYIERGWMIREESHLRLTDQGKLMADGIAVDLFI